MFPVLFVFFALGFPFFLVWAEPRYKVIQWLSPVIICYATGLLLANLPFIEIPTEMATTLSEVSVPLAIPLLLVSTNIRGWLGGARKAILSFVLCVVSVTVAASMAALLFKDQLPDSWKLAGMVMGVYTGGTPNMSAIGLSLEVPEETFILLNASDLILGAIYLFFLMTLARPILGFILPRHEQISGQDDEMEEESFRNLPRTQIVVNVLLFFGLVVILLGTSIGLSVVLAGNIQAVMVILTVTTGGILLSFVSRLRERPGSYDLGEYFLLIFCLAMGSLADISELASAASDTLTFTAVAMFGSILLHILLAAIFRIDRDTVIITSVAGIYGPAFVGPIAKVLNNKSVILTGMTTGLIGYAIGNYLGIGVAMLLRGWF